MTQISGSPTPRHVVASHLPHLWCRHSQHLPSFYSGLFIFYGAISDPPQHRQRFAMFLLIKGSDTLSTQTNRIAQASPFSWAWVAFGQKVDRLFVAFGKAICQRSSTGRFGHTKHHPCGSFSKLWSLFGFRGERFGGKAAHFWGNPSPPHHYGYRKQPRPLPSPPPRF